MQDLTQVFDKYYDDYVLKGHTPEWVGILLRTALSKNITIDLWNQAVDDIRKVASDSESVLSFVKGLEEAIKDGSFAKLLNISKGNKGDGSPILIDIQHWFDDHKMLFPDLKNIVYHPTGDLVTRIEPESVEVKGYFYSVYTVEEMADKLSDGNTTEEVYNPKFNEVPDEPGGTVPPVQHCSITVDIPDWWVHKILIHTSRYEQTVDPTLNTAKYEVSIGADTDVELSDTEKYISGFINPHIITVNKPISSLTLSVDIEQKDSGCLPIREIEFLYDDNVGYYTFEFTNGDVIRVDTYNMSLVLGELRDILEECQALDYSMFNRIQEITGNDNRSGGYARIGSDGFISKDVVPDIITIENFNIIFDSGIVPTEEIINEALTQLTEAKRGDYANIVEEIKIPPIENPNTTPNNYIKEQVVRRTYILLGDDPTQRSDWKLKITDFSYKASHADTASISYSTDSIRGVPVIIGNIDMYNQASKANTLFVITNYATDEEL